MGRSGLDAPQRQISAEEMALAHVPAPLNFNAEMVGPGDRRIRVQEIKERFLPRDGQPGHLVVPGFSEPGSRLGPGVAAHQGGARR